MKTQQCTVLALALAAVLVAPSAWAGKGGKNADQAPPATGSPVSDAVRSEGQPVADTAATTGQTVSQTAREANAATQDNTSVTTSNQVTTSNDASTDAASTQATPPRSAHERMVNNPTNTEGTEKPTPPAPPAQSQGATHAADHASVTQRELWGRLDSDGDGQISASESAVDAEFNAGFQAMDTNDDGLVTDTEYRTAARADLGSGQGQGGVNAAAHSTASVRDLVGRLDTNADGSISATEAQADAGFNASFATADANSDGMVSSQEYQAWAKAQRK